MCNHNDGEQGCCGKHGGGHHEGVQMTKEEKVAHLEKTITKLQEKMASIKSGQDTEED